MFGLAQVDRLNGDVSLFMTDAYEGCTDYRVRTTVVGATYICDMSHRRRPRCGPNGESSHASLSVTRTLPSDKATATGLLTF